MNFVPQTRYALQATARVPSQTQQDVALPLLLQMDTIVVLVMSGKTETITAIPAGIPTTRSFQVMIATMLMAGTMPVAGTVTGTAGERKTRSIEIIIVQAVHVLTV